MNKKKTKIVYNGKAGNGKTLYAKQSAPKQSLEKTNENYDKMVKELKSGNDFASSLIKVFKL